MSLLLRIRLPLQYQLIGSGQKPAAGFSLMDLNETRAWLEAKLGRLLLFRQLAAQGEDEADDDGAPGREAAE